MEQFEAGLSVRPQAILGNKIDLTDAKANFVKLKNFLEEEGDDTALLPISGRELINVKDLLLKIKCIIDDSKNATK